MQTAPSSTVVPLEFTFDWDEREHARLYRAITRSWSGRSGPYRWLAAFLGILFLIVFVPAALSGDAGAFAMPLAWLVCIGLGLLALRWWTPRQVARTHRRESCCIDHPMTRRIDGEGVHSVCRVGESLTRWEGVRSAVETDEFFLFFVTPRCAVQLPRRAIPTDVELKELRALLRDRLGARAELLG